MSRRWVVRVGVGLALAGLLAASSIGAAGGDARPVHAQSVVEIDMQNNQFLPGDTTIAAGTVVLWVNAEDPALGADGQHDVVDGNSGQQLSPDLVSQGESFSFEFDTPGVFPYLCDVHQNMNGTITVR